MARKSHGTHSELIKCENCNEDFSSTYKYCPFCGTRPDKGGLTQTFRIPFLTPKEEIPDEDKFYEDEDEDEEYEDDYVFEGGDIFDDEEDGGTPRAKGGKRLAEGGSGSSAPRIAAIIFSLALIVAAALIVATVIVPMIRRGDVDTPDITPSPAITDEPDVTPAPSQTIPVDQTATGFTLDREEFTISARYPEPVQITATLTPEGSTGTLTWTSSDTDVAIVDETGLVTAVGVGRCTIIATLPSGVTQTCTVISTVTSSDPVNSGSLTLSREDITLNSTWPNYTFSVTGASGDVTWSTSNSSIATVNGDGTVKRVGIGRCTITATDTAGQTATCVVRCN